ncbi:MAG: endolytic transglycosylase MltG [Pseudomonadota bacterium]|nr:endolytic transglycosylase MltG [Pseudomonadota bacterium]
MSFSRLLIAIVLILLSTAAVGGWIAVRWLEHYRTTPLSGYSDPVVFAVERGDSLARVARELTKRDILPHERPFRLIARWQGVAGAIKAGEYQIQPAITPQALLDQLVRGEVLQHRLTLVEGWSFRDVMVAISTHDALTHDLKNSTEQEIMAAIGRPGEHPEGRFFPDTYAFARGTSDITVLKQAYAAMERQLAAAWAERQPDLPLKTPYEALILASIVEKETGLPDERSQIAGVFVRRLRLGMRLQTDPTVIYGLGSRFDGNLTRAHLREKTDYNTYRISGLPPTPIALPGRASLVATVQPASGDSLFFVARGDGGHVFSATLKEHEQAVRCYQLGRCK